jgi:hypothetical protein
MLVLTADQKVRLTVSYRDNYGNTASVDGPTRWEVSDESIVTVTPGADGTSADVVTVGPAGTAQVRAIADAVAGEGERLIIGIQEIQVVGGEARIVALTAGAAEAKDDAAPPAEDEPPVDEGDTPAPV